MFHLGHVKLVQVQRASLKVGRRPDAVYDPAPLLVVPRLLITPGGVIGVGADGERIVDVHHVDHPQSRHGGENGVSVGFTGHYRSLRARFGTHLTDGIAGENILVETPDDPARVVTLGELGRRLVFRNPDTGAQVTLAGLKVAAPCVEFGGFAAGAGLPGPEMRAVLQFLHDGRRGFYATLDGPTENAFVRPGDLVFAADDGEAMGAEV